MDGTEAALLALSLKLRHHRLQRFLPFFSATCRCIQPVPYSDRMLGCRGNETLVVHCACADDYVTVSFDRRPRAYDNQSRAQQQLVVQGVAAMSRLLQFCWEVCLLLALVSRATDCECFYSSSLRRFFFARTSDRTYPTDPTHPTARNLTAFLCLAGRLCFVPPVQSFAAACML